MEKFRSIKAFTNYKGKQSDKISPMRIISLLKEAGGSLRKSEIAARLDIDMETVNKIVVQLLSERVVEVHRANDPKEDLVVI